MDNFVVSARKYRPQKFEDVIGQQSIANTLKLAIKNQKLASAYLFCGPRGVGKTTCARIFAKAINCLNPKADGEACEECESCVSFNEQRSVNIQELNAAANNSVEDIRAIIDQVRIPPQLGKYKVIILDEVHMLSQAAGNALLKTLEEPPSYVIFILATTEKHKIMQTILSRCQVFDFNRMEISDIISNLKMVAANEGITCDEAALNVIAQKADGGMRDALSIFDQVNNFSQGNITHESVLQCINAIDYEFYFQMTTYLVEHKIVEAMLLYNDIVNKGFNGGVFISGLAAHLRDVLMSHDPATMPLLNVAESLKQRYVEQARQCPIKFLYHTIRTCDRCANEYKNSGNKRLSVEITLIEAAQYGTDDAEASGLGPEQLLPQIKLKRLFRKTQTVSLDAQSQPQNPSQPAPTPEQQPSDTAGDTQSSATTATNQPVQTNTTPSQPATTPGPRIIKLGGRVSVKSLMQQANNQQQNQPQSQQLSAQETATSQPTPPSPTVDSPAPTTYDGKDYEDPDDREDTDPDSSTEVTEEMLNEAESRQATIRRFSDSQIGEAWKQYYSYIEQKDPSMSGRMQMMILQCNESEHLLTIKLHNANVQKDFAVYQPYVEQHLRNYFSDPDIKITTEVLPYEIVRVITNPAELLKKMRNEHPHFASLVDKVKLDFA